MNNMNNMSMLDQKRYQAEFLRYSQIPYESQYQQHQSLHASNMSLHQFNKYKEQSPIVNPVKVLPDVKFDSKLRTTNNGAILHSGGTISGRKESDVSVYNESRKFSCSLSIFHSVWLASLKKHFGNPKYLLEQPKRHASTAPAIQNAKSVDPTVNQSATANASQFEQKFRIES